MTEHPLVVAIDGPAGTGKSTVSQAVARARGFGYLDTGAVYRALAWAVLDAGCSTDDPDAVIRTSDSFHPVISLDPERRTILVADRDVTDDIRTPEITAATAGVARTVEVRRRVNDYFRRMVRESELPGVVIEGRDITTVVAPDAPVRVLLTADPRVRAARRSGDMTGADPRAVARAIAARDASDSTVADFLTAAEGVQVVDTTLLTFDESVAAVLGVLDAAKTNEEGAP